MLFFVEILSIMPDYAPMLLGPIMLKIMLAEAYLRGELSQDLTKPTFTRVNLIYPHARESEWNRVKGKGLVPRLHATSLYWLRPRDTTPLRVRYTRKLKHSIIRETVLRWESRKQAAR